MNNISKNLSKLFNVTADAAEVGSLTKCYEHLSVLFGQYEKSLMNKIISREVDKEKLFQESRLCIKLGKFKGYQSDVDIYTFHDDFNKLYQRTTPKRLMPDLLKNNHLEEPALSLVKSIDDIDEIWSTLIAAYGDAKMMLDKKIKQLQLVESLWRLKEPERII